MEIVVSKIKVTKSVIGQMPFPTLEVLKNGDVLGVVINVVKDQYKTMLIAYNNEFYKIAMDWKKGETHLFKRTGKWVSEHRLKTPELCNEYWENYTRCVKIAENKHLYI